MAIHINNAIHLETNVELMLNVLSSHAHAAEWSDELENSTQGGGGGGGVRELHLCIQS